jgi:hypothetical protein|tara:strand:+ start:1239 stop:1649 length:411 start_codon:yes stop_codon:yes gene_type:complete
MKVKISKTIDINQIPGEVRRMLDQAKNDLLYGLPDQMSQVVRSSLSSDAEEFFTTITMIDAFRQNLAAFDQNLQEIQSVFSGYKNALAPPPDEGPAKEYEEPEEELGEKWIAQEQPRTDMPREYAYETDEVEDEEG